MTIFDIDLKLLKQSPWEHAYEIVGFYRTRSDMYQTAFIMLLNGDKDNDFVKAVSSTIHETRHEGIIKNYMNMELDAAKYHKTQKEPK